MAIPTKPINDIFTYWSPDPMGKMLGTRMNRFSSRFGIDGLGRDNGDGRLDLLAVHALYPGSGQFRRFITACKDHYSTICVWHIDNRMLRDVLDRYGFKEEVEISGLADGEVMHGMRWDL